MGKATTIEVDVHASSLRLFSEDYDLGFDLPETEDLYTHGKLSGLNREITKKIVTASLNGITLDRKSWPKSFSEKEKDAQLIAGQDWLTYAKPSPRPTRHSQRQTKIQVWTS